MTPALPAPTPGEPSEPDGPGGPARHEVSAADERAARAARADRAAAHLAALVRIPTVSSRDPQEVDGSRFDELVVTLAQLYPRVHAELELDVVGERSVLLRWPGTGGPTAAPGAGPVVLMAHYDVVPVTGVPLPVTDVEAPAPGWTVPPFAGVVRDGAVWGRGTLDDKGSLVVVLEAVEGLLAAGFRPRRDVYLSFGHDEETSGSGARGVVALLHARGVRPWLVLDEGGAVVEGAMPGIRRPTAMVGIAEKGTVDIELVTHGVGGHASTPVRGGATVRLARAITRVDAHPFPARLTEPVLALLDALARHATGPARGLLGRVRGLATGNVAGRAVSRGIASGLARTGAETNAIVRTTVAVTQLHGSPGANVLATTARANLNVRIATGETVAGVVGRLRRVIADDAVELRVVDRLGAAATDLPDALRAVSGGNPSPVSPAAGPQWDVLGEALAASYPDALLTPYVQTGASDSRFFCAISEHVYRFSPLTMSAAQRGGIHGTDEHVDVDALGHGVAFHEALLRAV